MCSNNSTYKINLEHLVLEQTSVEIYKVNITNYKRFCICQGKISKIEWILQSETEDDKIWELDELFLL
jgi:hypothetical protein